MYDILIRKARIADGPGNPGHQLHVQTPTGNVVIFRQGKDLCLVRIAVVIGAVQNPVNILGETGPPNLCRFAADVPTDRHAVSAGAICEGTAALFLLHTCRQFC